MGNCLCHSPNKKALRSPIGIRVIHADSGRISMFLPTPSSLYAGEVMLDHPNHYLCCLSDFQIGCQMLPVPADRCLEPAHAYVLLPMRNLRSRVSNEDLSFFLASLNLVATANDDGNIEQLPANEGKLRSRKRFRNRVLPLMSSSLSPPPPPNNLAQYGVGGCLDIATNLHQVSPLFRSRSLGLGEDLVAAEDDMLGQVMRMKSSLSWMPKLEPIEENE